MRHKTALLNREERKEGAVAPDLIFPEKLLRKKTAGTDTIRRRSKQNLQRKDEWSEK
jgi:hypothetical protein